MDEKTGNVSLVRAVSICIVLFLVCVANRKYVICLAVVSGPISSLK